MTDDPPKRRARSVWGDDERIAIGRTRRSEAVPEHIERELTPIDLRIERLDDRLSSLATEAAANSEAIEGFMKPAIKGVMARLDTLVSYHEKNQARTDVFHEEQWPELVRRFAGMDDRLGRLERSQEKQIDAGQAVAARLTAVEAVGNSHGVRITALERHNEDTKLVVAERKRWFSWARAGLVTVAGGVGWLVSHFADWFRK